MFSLLTSKILNYFLGGSIIAMALALGAVTLTKNATINELRHANAQVVKERDAARDDLRTSRANQRELEISIKDQNGQISRMVGEGEVRQKLVDSLREDGKAKSRVVDILSRKGESCEDADKLIMEVTR